MTLCLKVIELIIIKLNVITSTAHICHAFDNPIVDSLARCLDDGNFIFHLATTVRDLIGTQNTSKDDVYNEAAEVYAATLRYSLRALYLNLYTKQ